MKKLADHSKVDKQLSKLDNFLVKHNLNTKAPNLFKNKLLPNGQFIIDFEVDDFIQVAERLMFRLLNTNPGKNKVEIHPKELVKTN